RCLPIHIKPAIRSRQQVVAERLEHTRTVWQHDAAGACRGEKVRSRNRPLRIIEPIPIALKLRRENGIGLHPRIHHAKIEWRKLRDCHSLSSTCTTMPSNIPACVSVPDTSPVSASI